MLKSLPSSGVRTFLVTEAGELLTGGKRQVGRASPKSWAVLSRGLCRFEFLSPAPGVSARAARAAARLAAEARAPFADTGGLVTADPEGCGAWWWDAGGLRQKTEEAWPYQADQIVPESLLYAPGDGLRQIRTTDGYEAQFWRNGTLIASSWRRRPFTQEQWSVFVRTARIPANLHDTPTPQPVALELRYARAAGIRRLRPTSDIWNRTGLIAASLCAVSVIAITFFTAQALRFISDRTEEVARTDASVTRAGPALTQAYQDLDTLERLADLQTGPKPLTAARVFIAEVESFGCTVGSWSIENALLTASIRLNDMTAPEELATALERNPWFQNVVPGRRDGPRLMLTATLCAGDKPGPCSSEQN